MKKNMPIHIKIYTAIVFIFLSQNLLAQKNNIIKSNDININGLIKDEENDKPVENVIVKLIATKDSSQVYSSLTDVEGKFELKAKNDGNYILKLSLIGYELKKIKLLIDKNQKTINTGDIKIKSTSINLDEVKIEGNYKLKIDVDKKIYRIDANAVSANGTAGDILQNIPSVFVNQNGTVTLRGGNVKIYVNGKPSGILGISRSQILDYIPASLIESVEVINDPSAKYDADGSSGIINIILKNQNKPGINGLISISAGTLDRYNGSANLSFNYKKLSLFTSYDIKNVNIESWETKNRSDRQGVEKYVNQERDFWSKTNNQNFRLRGEYAFNKKSILGFSFLNSKTIDSDKNIFAYKQLDTNFQLTDLYNRTINEKDHDNSNNFTLNYTKKFKKTQQQLSTDLFYSKGTENTLGDIYQKYFNLDGTPSTQLPGIANTYNYNSETNIVGQIDYDQPISKKAKLELGIKIRSKITNASYKLENYYQPMDIYITDALISNDFKYNLQVNAGYITYRNKINKFSYKLGTRVEQSYINFNVSNGIKNSINYTDFFPSIHLLQEFKNNNKLTFHYSRRIDRPAFREISPLQQYNDPFFLNKGNPNILPEYTNSFDVTHTKSWKQSSISGSIYYRLSTGTIQKIVVLKTDGITETSYQNLNSSKNIGTEINAYFQLYNWWKINSSLNYYKNIIDGSNIGKQYQTDNFSYNGKINNNFNPWKNSMLQISAIYQSPTYSPLIKNYGQYYVDASFKQDLLNKKISLSIRCTDIFLSQKRNYDMIDSNFSVNSRFNRQSRVIYFGITYRPFRNHKKAEGDEKEGDEEENNSSNIDE
jgi:ferric enterobactin receptor